MTLDIGDELARTFRDYADSAGEPMGHYLARAVMTLESVKGQTCRQCKHWDRDYRSWDREPVAPDAGVCRLTTQASGVPDFPASLAIGETNCGGWEVDDNDSWLETRAGFGCNQWEAAW